MLMAGLGGCGGPRVSHRGREGAGRAGHGGGVFEGRGHSSGGPMPLAGACRLNYPLLSLGSRCPGPDTCSRCVPGAALSVWTSKGDNKQGRIRGPWCTRRTLDVHLTPGIRAPRNPDSLTLSGGP